MAELKTKANDAPVADFLNAIPDAQLREDCWTIVQIMQSAAQAPPKMWGPGIVGFGEYQYLNGSGKKVDWMLTAFSPRKQSITLYIMDGFGEHEELLSRLGVHSCGKACLYIKRLSDIHLPTLKKLVKRSVQQRIASNAASK